MDRYEFTHNEMRINVDALSEYASELVSERAMCKPFQLSSEHNPPLFLSQALSPTHTAHRQSVKKSAKVPHPNMEKVFR